MLKNLRRLLFLILFSGLFFFCKSNDLQGKKKNKQPTFIENKTSREVYNQDKSKILILNYSIHISPIITYNFKVVDSRTKKELKKGVFVGEKVEWLDNSTLKCTKHIGMIQKQDDRIPSSDNKKNTSNNYITVKINENKNLN